MTDNIANDAAFVDEKTIKLRKCISLGSGDKAVSYDHLDLREPTAGELAKAMKSGADIDAVISLISIVAQVPRGAVEKLCQRDLEEASDFLSSFSAAAPTTGETSSPS